VLERAGGKLGLGRFRQRLVRTAAGAPLGWYLYYVKPGGVGEVAQVAAMDSSAGAVLDHLFHDAWRCGLVGLSGQLDPRLMRELSEKSCLFRHGGPWMLVHSPDAEVLHALHRGDAFLTRLDGEWWINL
jgi:hypothetical protein